MRLLACAILAVTSTATAEPVRDDITDLRHHRMPTPLRFLGWTADGRAVLHEASYGFQDDSCMPQGGSTLLTVRDDGTGDSIPLLQPVVDDDFVLCSDAFPWRVPTALASRAIRAEARALAALGPLQPGVPAKHPELSLVRGPCWLHLAARTHGHTHTIARVLTIGPETCVADGHDLGIRDAQIVDMHASPDGRSLAVTVNVTTQSMDFYDSFVQTVVVATPST